MTLGTEGDVTYELRESVAWLGLNRPDKRNAIGGAWVPLSARGETVIPERFQPEHIVELLARYRVTFFCGGPPAIYAAILAARNLQGADLSALRMYAAGGAPVPVELMERWRRATGLQICEGYGMSNGADQRRERGDGRPAGSVGKSVSGSEVQAVGPGHRSARAAAGRAGRVADPRSAHDDGYRNQP